MNLKAYFAAGGNAKRAREAMAEQIGTSSEYLRMVSAGHRQASPAMARKIHEASHFAVTLEEIRPDIWGDSPRRESGTTQKEPA
jgi:DNA-binding transcriptional regulator YdaS (Cro superfamily)